MERDERDFERKTEQAKQENQRLRRARQGRGEQRDQVEAESGRDGGLAACQNNEGNQQRDAAGEHDQEIARGRQRAIAGGAPAAEQEIERHQRQFPEKEKEHGIEGTKNPQRGRLEGEQQAVVQARGIVHQVPAGDE